ncbi:UDP-3-O-acylglucosamine N-acyltransferase [Aquicella siphonis]|uniref:UDP-3-O-acylglucosamine N-acyltransferase n=1 Tax=Aquicella siphonis TaxID=254247 RepID=A0A5E4PFV7_9COXI|nr:UDP-3-O-(3-hydroxymyristoyl)glucosamine N-acyltransferase [Aquicella siphonis]VVC75327.1 UDP-3-O-acylglucosamine N-acyltransferase [Aquicella siphonis]
MKSANKLAYKLADLISGLDVILKGDPDCLITGISPIQQSQPGHITFLTNSLYRKHLAGTRASAVILAEGDAALCPVNAVISRNPYFTYAKIASFFTDRYDTATGMHPAAVMGEDCSIDASAVIGAHVTLGRHVKIGANVVIGPGSTIGDHVEIGEGTQLDARVAVYHKVRIGRRCCIASGAVIGSDGFGFANQKGVWHKVPQLGSVEIGDDVDIGANTTIDRGAVENTVIEDGAKLDNLIQVGHNVRIGANTIIAGCVAIAGSTVIGKNCMIGGASTFAGHITIGDNVMITGMTAVTKSIREPGIYSSGIVGAVTNKEFRKNNARFHRMENLMERVKSLEIALKELTERKES